MVPGKMFVDARGFDLWWFWKLLPSELQNLTDSKEKRDAMAFKRDFAFHTPKYPF
jgi:hypothetical protein